MKIALVGNGAIAKLVSEFCATSAGRLTVVAALGLPSDVRSVGKHPIVQSLAELLAFNPDLVVECAGHSAVVAYATPVLEAGLDLVIVSTGSLADAALWQTVRTAASRSKGRVKLPAGALPGIDALSAARLAGLTTVTLRSSKPPKAWKGTPAEKTHDLDAITEPTVIFSGNARAAALTFPKNANVAATAALAGLGFEATTIMLVADPGITQNVHHLEAAGAFGSMTLRISANPSPDNPKTSHMAALSIMRLLENEASAIVI
ncbi:MAG: aspartate dehydrogenase [Rhodospirillaceae bacterium]|nr:aspartate dehydrogenase [Rhodospirillaceae bacterium]